MSGHSKWSTIKHKKALTDQKKGQLFSKLSKIISIAAKDGPDPVFNSKLKNAIEKAKSVNMPNANIDKAIKRITDKGATQLKEVQFEIIGPGQVVIIVEAITDNSNRTLGDIRSILTKHDSKLAERGAIAWNFTKMGVIKIPSLTDPENKRQNLVAEDVELQIIEAGAEDIQKEGDTMTIRTKPELLEQVKSTLVAMALTVEYAEIEMVPKTTLKVADPKERQKLEKLFEELDEHEEVGAIYSNLQ